VLLLSESEFRLAPVGYHIVTHGPELHLDIYTAIATSLIVKVVLYRQSSFAYRAVQACPPWKDLLETNEEKVVFEQRMRPAAEIFEPLLSTQHCSMPTMTWHDAYNLFYATLAGSAAQDPLPLLLGSTLEQTALQAPKVWVHS
jgi:hypothetical protein